MSIVAAGAPGTHTDPRNTLPPPPSASFNAFPALPAPPAGNPTLYSAHQVASGQDRPKNSIEDSGDDDEIQWSPAIQKLYDAFLADERMYVAEGLWDRFPTGSRLFIGNLPTEKVTKRDLFYVFHKYGRLAQVSIKQAYGFVQFHDVEACHTALGREQGQEIRGRKMHLEISKPQKNTRQANQTQQQNAQRRSKSPTRSNKQNRNQTRNQADTYDGRALMSPREQDYRNAPVRGRDDYRHMRSPTPPRGSYRGHNDYPPVRGGGDHYSGQQRRRSRSRSPIYDRRDPGRYRERSLSPRRPIDEDAALGIPRRDPRDVPDVQILLLEELDRNFIQWVESELRQRNLKTEVMFLSPRFPLDVVVRRQILEGVTALVKLSFSNQQASKIPLQVFDRSLGADNVRFDEYENLEPRIAAELVIREKRKTASAPLPQSTYGQHSSYGQPLQQQQQQYGLPPVTVQQPQQQASSAAPNLANIVGQLDNATLQKLLGTLNSPLPPPQQNPIATQQNGQIDLAGILGGLMGNQSQLTQQPVQSQYGAPEQGQYVPQNLGALLGNVGGNGQLAHQGQPAQGAGSAQQVQNIMAQLARFRQ